MNLNNHKIKNLSNPTQDNEAITKDYVDKLVHTTAQPSHYKDELAYLMSSGSQWTDEIVNETNQTYHQTKETFMTITTK